VSKRVTRVKHRLTDLGQGAERGRRLFKDGHSQANTIAQGNDDDPNNGGENKGCKRHSVEEPLVATVAVQHRVSGCFLLRDNIDKIDRVGLSTSSRLSPSCHTSSILSSKSFQRV